MLGNVKLDSVGKRDNSLSRFETLLVFLILNDRAKTKLAILAFLCCREIVKNSIANFAYYGRSLFQDLCTVRNHWILWDKSIPGSLYSQESLDIMGEVYSRISVQSGIIGYYGRSLFQDLCTVRNHWILWEKSIPGSLYSQESLDIMGEVYSRISVQSGIIGYYGRSLFQDLCTVRNHWILWEKSIPGSLYSQESLDIMGEVYSRISVQSGIIGYYGRSLFQDLCTVRNHWILWEKSIPGSLYSQESLDIMGEVYSRISVQSGIIGYYGRSLFQDLCTVRNHWILWEKSIAGSLYSQESLDKY